MPDVEPILEPHALRRYSRQILLDEIGLAGQQKISAAKVFVIGAGGLGSPAALYLAAAGVGTLGIADHDAVEEHNLQRQLLHSTVNIGKPKVDSAITALLALNPHVQLIPHRDGITADNALELFESYDIIVDGTDNFLVRYLNNDAAYFTRRPLVHGSVFKFEGQISVFDTSKGGPCYRCLFPEPPTAGSVPACGEAGVMGALCGIIGSMQAMEVIKLITGCSPAIVGRLLIYDAFSHQTQSHGIKADPHCPLCGNSPEITAIKPEHYRFKCEAVAEKQMSPTEYPTEISVHEASELLRTKSSQTLLIDVRESSELQICQLEMARHIPMREIPAQLENLPKSQHLLILCHSGMRSRSVTDFLRTNGISTVSNIAGGINAWAVEIDPTLTRY